MSDVSDIYGTQFGPSVTFADPVSPTPLADIWSTGSKTLTAGNMMDQGQALSDAYDARIANAKQIAGVELENPARGGYSREARQEIRRQVIAGGMAPIDEKGGIPAFQRRIFDDRLAELQAKHPELSMGFGPTVDDDAAAMVKKATEEHARAMDQPINPVLKYGTAFLGGMWAQRRDPLFVGSLFAGPVTAGGRTALARVASSALNQGLFNAGLSAVEQPQVQEWRAKTGQESGVIPAIEDIGLAFATGMIPGAATEGLKEIATPLRRLMSGRPEPGDLAKAGEVLGSVTPRDAAALHAGEEAMAADRAILSEPAPKDVAPALHDDMLGAALKRADDPEAPSPEAVAASNVTPPPALVVARKLPDGSIKLGEPGEVHSDLMTRTELNAAGPSPPEIEASMGYATQDGRFLTRMEALDFAKRNEPARAAFSAQQPEHGLEAATYFEATRPNSSELQARIEAAAPATERDAQVAADEALDDFGRRDGMAALRERMATDRTDEEAARRVQSFTTAKGSAYEVHEDGTTTRTKAARADLGHEGDSGLKPRSAKTVYVQDARVFNPPDSAKWRVVDHGDGTMSLAVQNDDGRWGISPDSRNIKFQTEPKVGLQPLELWKPDTLNGKTAYRGVHPGNAITEMGTGSAVRLDTKDPLGKVPFVDANGKMAVLSQKTVRSQGEREDLAAMLVRSCK